MVANVGIWNGIGPAGHMALTNIPERAERKKLASGATGITFEGMMGYVKTRHPRMVICENVRGK